MLWDAGKKEKKPNLCKLEWKDVILQWLWEVKCFVLELKNFWENEEGGMGKGLAWDMKQQRSKLHITREQTLSNQMLKDEKIVS